MNRYSIVFTFVNGSMMAIPASFKVEAKNNKSAARIAKKWYIDQQFKDRDEPDMISVIQFNTLDIFKHEMFPYSKI